MWIVDVRRFGIHSHPSATIAATSGWEMGIPEYALFILLSWDCVNYPYTVEWQVTLCAPTWHVSFRGGEASCKVLYCCSLLYFTAVSGLCQSYINWGMLAV